MIVTGGLSKSGYFILLTAILFILLLWELYYFYREITSISIPTAQSVSTTQDDDIKKAQAAYQEFSFGNIDAANIFGDFIATVDLANARETALNLKLVGVFFNNDNKKSAAVLITNGKEKTYRIGDKIMENVILSAIYKNYVVIDHAGKAELVKYPEQDFSSIELKPYAGLGR